MKKAQTQDHLGSKEIWNFLPIPTFHTVAHVHVATCICWWNVGMGRELQISLHPE